MNFIHGILKGYRIEYRIVKVGYGSKTNKKYGVQWVMVSPFHIKTTIKHLSPNAVYEIRVMAVNEHGIGIKSQVIYGGNFPYFVRFISLPKAWFALGNESRLSYVLNFQIQSTLCKSNSYNSNFATSNKVFRSLKISKQKTLNRAFLRSPKEFELDRVGSIMKVKVLTSPNNS